MNIKSIGSKIKGDEVRRQYEKYSTQNTYCYFDEMTGRFIEANKERYEYITQEAGNYIRKAVGEFGAMDMFVSFSGGKDSTVTSNLVLRALSTPQIMHIFGDTTLEFMIELYFFWNSSISFSLWDVS